MNVDLNEIAKKMAEQDNCGTSDPLYCAYVPQHVFHVNEEESDGVVFVCKEDSEIVYESLSEVWQSEEHKVAADGFFGDEEVPVEVVFDEIFYKTLDGSRGKFITAFFTESDAKDFIENQSHNFPDAYLYVNSCHNNMQMKGVCELLMSCGFEKDNRPKL